MNGFQVKIYMVQVKPKTLVSLQNILSGSVDDSENLIVDLEELNSTLSELTENDRIYQFIKDVLKTIDNEEVKYVWFYL